MEINYAFIDSQNLNLGTRSAGWQLDFKKFRLYLKNKYSVQKAFLFIGYMKSNESLYEKLESYGYTIIFKPTMEYHKGWEIKVKGNVDAELVLHTIINIEKYSKAIIVSGDGDFYCLVEYLITQSKLKALVVPNYKYSTLYRDFLPIINNLTKHKGELCKKKVTEINGRSKP